MKQRMLDAIARANDDGEFALAARLWDGDVVFIAGNNAVRMTVRAGRIAEAADAAADAPASIRIRGPEDGWRKMLLPVPPPFYQDLYGASLHHGFTLEGRIEDVGPYYPALRRLIDLARAGGGA